MGLLAKPVPAVPSPRFRRAQGWGVLPQVLADVERLGGEWAEIGHYTTVQGAGSMAYRVRRRYDPDGRYEFTARTVDGRGVLYARLRTGDEK